MSVLKNCVTNRNIIQDLNQFITGSEDEVFVFVSYSGNGLNVSVSKSLGIAGGKELLQIAINEINQKLKKDEVNNG